MDESADRPWNRREAERALTLERDRYSAMSVNLLDLADEPTCRLLAGAPLRGATREAWAAAAAALDSAWAHLGAYQVALEEAEAIFRGRPRPGSTQWLRLQGLLSQASVSQDSGAIPPAEREAAGPAIATRSTSLVRLRTAMEAEYRQVASVVAAVGEVWQAVDERSTQLAADLEHAVGEARHTGAAAAAALLGERLTRIRAVAQSDPLSLRPDWPAPGPVDTTRLEDLRRDLDALRAEIEDLRRLRAHGAERLTRLRGQVQLVEAAEAKAAAGRKHALSRVLADLPPPPDAAPALRRRLAAAETLHRRRYWTALGTALGELETHVPAAEKEAHEAGERAAALLAERDRLRGRLLGYQARARRLGLIEEPAISTLFQQVQGRLWAAPCDLRAATEAVERFRREIEHHTDDGPGGSS